MGWPKGVKFSEEHRQALVDAHQDSVKFQNHLRLKLHSSIKGVKKTLEMRAAVRATWQLRKIGLTKETNFEMWQTYYNHFLKILKEKEAAAEASVAQAI